MNVLPVDGVKEIFEKVKFCYVIPQTPPVNSSNYMDSMAALCGICSIDFNLTPAICTLLPSI